MVPRGNSAISHVAAGIDAEFTVHLRVISPEQPAGSRVIGFDQAPRRRHIHHPIDDQGRRFLSSVGVEIRKPSKAQLLCILVVDARQRAEALLIVGAAIGEPVAGFGIGNSRAVDWFVTGLGGACRTARQSRQQQSQRHTDERTSSCVFPARSHPISPNQRC